MKLTNDTITKVLKKIALKITNATDIKEISGDTKVDVLNYINENLDINGSGVSQEYVDNAVNDLENEIGQQFGSINKELEKNYRSPTVQILK